MGCAASAFEKDTLITVTADQRPIALDNPRSAVSTKCATRVEESTDGSSSYQKVNQSVEYLRFLIFKMKCYLKSTYNL